MAPGINDIHHVVDTTMGGLSIVLNCYLLYIIKYYSTFGVKLYQYLLTIDALLDLFLGVGAFLQQPVAIIGEGYTVHFSNGFFYGRSPVIESALGTFYLFALHTNVIWIPVQFVYRYRLLCNPSSNSHRVAAVIIAVGVVYSLIALAVVHVGNGQVRDEYQTIGQHVLDLNDWPKVKNGSRHFFMGHYFKDWGMIAYVMLWSTTCCASIGIVIWCEKMIGKHFNRLGDLSGPTQRMHKEFRRALLAMAICPLVTTSIPVFYFMVVIALKLCPGTHISAIMTILLSSITVFNPLTTIMCFRCYRQVTARLITCGRYGRAAKVETTPCTAKVTILSVATSADTNPLVRT